MCTTQRQSMGLCGASKRSTYEGMTSHILFTGISAISTFSIST